MCQSTALGGWGCSIFRIKLEGALALKYLHILTDKVDKMFKYHFFLIISTGTAYVLPLAHRNLSFLMQAYYSEFIMDLMDNN